MNAAIDAVLERPVESLMGLMLVAVLFVAGDCAGGHTESHRETVIGKEYVPGQWRVQAMVDANGRSTTQNVYDAERWILLTTDDQQDAHSCEVRSQEWGVAVGSEVNVNVRVGAVTGWRWRMC